MLKNTFRFVNCWSPFPFKRDAVREPDWIERQIHLGRRIIRHD
jgi:hypothetical protein